MTASTDNKVQAIVATARRDMTAWASKTPKERGRHLLRVRDAVATGGAALVDQVVAATGQSRSDAWFEVMSACTSLTWSAKAGPRHLRPRTLATRPFVLKKATLHHQPLGVVGVITPWNYPVAVPMHSIPNALVAGNIVVLKPDPLVADVARLLAGLINSAGVDLVHVLPGGADVGDDLVRSGIDKIVFTGRSASGRQVMAAAAATLTPVLLELGGNDAMVVLDDADVRQAARAAVGAAFFNAGQTCMAVQRVVVSEARHDEFVGEALAATRALDREYPRLREEQAALLTRRLADAVAAGARVMAGGPAPDGSFLPAVVTDVPVDSDLFQAENFGPVLTIVRATSEEHAVTLANSTPYGLAASVITRNGKRGRRVAAALAAGTVDINDAVFGAGVPGVPFGGTGASGFGRQKGVAGLREFTSTKTIVRTRLPGAPSFAAVLMAGKAPEPALLQRIVRLYWTSLSHKVKRKMR
ncbi:aldehyde dehydrogenase family protein [Lentzea sp. NPDC051213]|uniref:aldehyde dehydrogenase family protein n=1 Tax=Lentzea sp. NPDC051213 TaxID=3364126 RepID=UPI00379BD31C